VRARDPFQPTSGSFAAGGWSMTAVTCSWAGERITHTAWSRGGEVAAPQHLGGVQRTQLRLDRVQPVWA